MPFAPPNLIYNALCLEQIKIVQLIQNTVDQAFQSAEVDTRGKAGEVERLIYFFVKGLPTLEAGLKGILKPHNVSLRISSVFCHQTPKVRYTKPSIAATSCELGDVAFMATYGVRLGAARDGLGNAVLCQAKNLFSRGVEPIQEYLYEAAAEFEYVRPASLKAVAGGVRNLATADNCLWFWSFNHKSFPPWRTSLILGRPPHPSGQSYVDAFERILFQLFIGAAGRGYKDIGKRPAAHGWSRIIDDLFQITAARMFKLKSAPILRGGARPRGYNALTLSASMIIASDFPESASTPTELNRSQRRFEVFFGPHENDNSREPPGADRPGSSDEDDGAGSIVIFEFGEIG